MTPEEYNTQLSAVSLKLARHAMDEFNPFAVILLQNRQSKNFDKMADMFMHFVASCTAAQIGSIGLSLGMGKIDKGLEFSKHLAARLTINLIDTFTDLKSGKVESEILGEIDIATGKEVDFDFRDHLAPDSGRASEVGGQS